MEEGSEVQAAGLEDGQTGERQGTPQAFRGQKRPGNGFSFRASKKEESLAITLVIAWREPCRISGLQNCTIINFCCF